MKVRFLSLDGLTADGHIGDHVPPRRLLRPILPPCTARCIENLDEFEKAECRSREYEFVGFEGGGTHSFDPGVALYRERY